jgi:Family of unknown function (DUF6600)
VSTKKMRTRLAVLILAVALLAGAEFADVADLNDEARADAYFSFNLFFNTLAPYGNWVPVDGYGYGWYPSQVDSGWQPYSDGQWAWSNQGWTWISYEPWGWATYHYGRWIFDPNYGWLWIPGTVWAPAWVSWYQAPGYVGWSPLPPDNNFFLEIGISFVNYDYGYGGGYYGGNGWGYYGGNHHYYHDRGHYYDNNYYAPGDHCVFVPQNEFTSNNAKLVALQGSDRLTVMKNVSNVTDIKVENNKIYNYGPDKGNIERAEHGKLSQVDLVDSNLTSVKGSRNPNRLHGNKYSVFRPNIEKKQGDTPYTLRGPNSPGIRNSYTSEDKISGNGQALTGNTVRDRGSTYGNSTPVDYGVIESDRGSSENGMNHGGVTTRQSRGDAINPTNSRGTDNVDTMATDRGNNRYNVPSVNSEPIRIKSYPAGNRRQSGNYDAPVMQGQAVNRNPANYSQPENRNTTDYSNPGNGRSLNRTPAQPRNNYNPNGYNAQKYSNEYKPARNTDRSYSNNRKSNDSGNRNTNNAPHAYTSPSSSTGTRSHNTGNTRSNYGNSSFVQNSGH